MSFNDELNGPCIVTKYIGPTNYRGSRIKAIHKRDSETSWSKTLSWDHKLDAQGNHRAAAQALIEDWPFNEYNKFELKASGFDHNHYYFLAVSI
jgi:hypothetical protein